MNYIKYIYDNLKEKKKSNNSIIRFVARVILKGAHFCKVLLKSFVNKEYRALITMQLLHGRRVQQTTQLTWENRYPEIFAASKEYFDGKNEGKIKILSYGCCTGEEVITLRQYFPNAMIVGAEINRNSLQICKQREHDDGIHFVYSSPKNIRKFGPYDLVFCMAVLQRTPHMVENNNIVDISELYPYHKFEEQLHEIDSYVKNGGMLIVQYTQYDLLDTDIAMNYTEYGDRGYFGLTFDKNSKLKKAKSFRKSMYLKR